MLREQLILGDARARRVEFVWRGRRWRPVQEHDGVPQRLERRQWQVAAAIGGAGVQGAGDVAAQACAGDAAQRAVHRRQRGVWLVWPHGGRAILRMHHFAAGRAGARFAEAAQPHARAQHVSLAGGEVEEAHREKAAALLQRRGERPPPPVAGIHLHDLSAHQATLANLDLGQGHETGAVLIALRQVQQQIAHGADATFGEGLGHLRPHAAQRAHRVAARRHLAQVGSNSTASASTKAPRGSAATPTAARAG